jgi:hypothetical protein
MSALRERVKAVLQTFDSLSRQKEELLAVLSVRVEADEVDGSTWAHSSISSLKFLTLLNPFLRKYLVTKRLRAPVWK